MPNFGIRTRLRKHQEKIVSDYRNGVSTCELGRRYACSNASIWLFLQSIGVATRQTKVTEELKEKVVELARQGFSAYWISKETGLSQSSTNRAIRAAGISISHRQHKRDDPLCNHADDIIAQYEAGAGLDSIGTLYGCHNGGSIRALLKRNGVTIRAMRDYSYPVNEHFFDIIDTAEKAYVLGFMMADGCNQSHVPEVTLSITDLEILEKIRDAMEFKGPIAYRAPRGPRNKPQYRIDIGSRHMSDALTKVGCVRRKTYVAQFQTEDQVPRHLQRHLIRGWMDGDGTITCKPGKRNWNWRVVGTKAACMGMALCIESHLGFPVGAYSLRKTKTHELWGATICARRNLKSLLEWLYADSTIHLERKYAKYQEFLTHCFPV